jgi:ribosomal protein S18 acetylase RimI-like enzyme
LIVFRAAGEPDDLDLRAMLRANAMPSWVTMSTEREPSFLGSLNRFGNERVVIARDGEAAVGMYLCAEHPVHINGRPERFGYLGGLRVNPAYRHRRRVLREGYASIRSLSGVTKPDTWYTSVATENTSARRLLEAGLRDLPAYVAQGELVTLAISRARGKRLGLWRRPDTGEIEPLCDMYNASAARFQLSPELTPLRIKNTRADFFIHDVAGEPRACMALWDQQAYKQIVARAYREPLSTLLPLYNLWARLARRVVLPNLNQALDQAFLAFFAPGTDDIGETIALIRDALALSSCAVVTLGLHAAHPALPELLRACRPVVYRTIVYAVCFAQPPHWDGRPVQPEIAIL